MAASSDVGNLARHKEFLIERMDPDSGLLDKLLGKGTLTEREIREIDAKDPYHKRNSELLKFITEQGKDDLLIAALKDSKQNHLVNYLTANGVFRPEYRDDWPLTKTELSILNRNQEVLIDLIDPCDLIGQLYSRSVINRRQREVISSKPTSHEKNKAVLQILRRRSLRDFRQTIACLCKSNQLHIAEILEQGGVVARVHTNIDEAAETVGETENQLSSAIQAMIFSGKSIAEISLIMEQTLFKCIAAKVGQSIVLYIYCNTMDELQKLMESLTSGLLKSSCEHLFNRLLSRQQRVTLKSIKITDEDQVYLRKALEEFKLECHEKHGTSAEEVKCTSTEPEQLVFLEEKSGEETETLTNSRDSDKTRKQAQRFLQKHLTKPASSFFSKIRSFFRSSRRSQWEESAPQRMLFNMEGVYIKVFEETDEAKLTQSKTPSHFKSSTWPPQPLKLRRKTFETKIRDIDECYMKLIEETDETKLTQSKTPSRFKSSIRSPQPLKLRSIHDLPQGMEGTNFRICKSEFLKMVSGEVKGGLQSHCFERQEEVRRFPPS